MPRSLTARIDWAEARLEAIQDFIKSKKAPLAEREPYVDERLNDFLNLLRNHASPHKVLLNTMKEVGGLDLEKDWRKAIVENVEVLPGTSYKAYTLNVTQEGFLEQFKCVGRERAEAAIRRTKQWARRKLWGMKFVGETDEEMVAMLDGSNVAREKAVRGARRGVEKRARRAAKIAERRARGLSEVKAATVELDDAEA